MTPNPVPDWREILLDIHSAGLMWKAIGHYLGCNGTTVKDYAAGRTALFLTVERALWILKAHHFLCKSRYDRIQKEVEEFLRIENADNAIRRIIERG